LRLVHGQFHVGEGIVDRLPVIRQPFLALGLKISWMVDQHSILAGVPPAPKIHFNLHREYIGIILVYASSST
jgi:hypothetical protein